MRIFDTRALLGACCMLALIGGSAVQAQDNKPGVEKDDFAAGNAKDVIHYKVDPFWPKDLPNKWIFGTVAGVYVDSQDHIWALNRSGTTTVDELGSAQRPTRADCCNVTPAVTGVRLCRQCHQIMGWPGIRAGVADQ